MIGKGHDDDIIGNKFVYTKKVTTGSSLLTERNRTNKQTNGQRGGQTDPIAELWFMALEVKENRTKKVRNDEKRRKRGK